MVAPAAVGSHQDGDEKAIHNTETEAGRRVDEAIRTYFDRLVGRTEVPQHLLDLISGSAGTSDSTAKGPGPA